MQALGAKVEAATLNNSIGIATAARFIISILAMLKASSRMLAAARAHVFLCVHAMAHVHSSGDNRLQLHVYILAIPH
jgi:hypothetical protein